MAQQPLLGQGILETSQSHSYTPHSVELLWSNVRPVVRYLNVATHNTPEGQPSLPLAEFEPASPASNRLQPHDLDGAVTDVGAGKFIGS